MVRKEFDILNEDDDRPYPIFPEEESSPYPIMGEEEDYDNWRAV